MGNKMFLGLGVITIISGILLVFQHQYLIGVPGSIIGVWLVISNWNKIKEKVVNKNFLFLFFAIERHS